jgi:hypothetical protein
MHDTMHTSGKSLASFLAEEGTLTSQEAINVVRLAAREVAQLHETGRLHLAISTESLSFDDDGSSVRLAPPAEFRNFGGTTIHADDTPPVLQREVELRISTQLNDARRILQNAGIALEPELIDVYQLGALLCRLIGGESIDAYLRSPRARAKVPTAIQSIIDSSLGHDPATAFANLAEFSNALNAALGSNEQTLVEQVRSVSSNGDTAPSMAPHSRTDDTDVEPVSRGKAADRGELPFSTLGHYRIESHIGHGGMGDVQVLCRSDRGGAPFASQHRAGVLHW